MKIYVVRDKISKNQLIEWAQETYREMIKAVVDVEKGFLAVGGDLHADAEAALLEEGSRQEDLWGINLYPEKSGPDRIEYTSLINIKPRQSHRAMEIQDAALKLRISRLVNLRVAWDSK